MEIVAALIGLAGALLGALLGGFISIFFNQRSNRVKLTFDMHREGNDREMYSANTEAIDLLSKTPASMPLDQIYERNKEQADSIFNQIQFHQRLWLAIKYKQIHEPLVPELFGEPFVWWYIHCYEKHLRGVDAYRGIYTQISELHNWLKKRAAEDWGDWEKRQGRLAPSPMAEQSCEPESTNHKS